MKLRVTSTTTRMYSESNKAPCEGAYLNNLPKLRTEEMRLPTFSDFDAKFGEREGTWCSKGVNHLEENGYVLREVPQTGEGWYVKLISLKALKEFISEHGECVLSEIDGELVIEIYDNYRE